MKNVVKIYHIYQEVALTRNFLKEEIIATKRMSYNMYTHARARHIIQQNNGIHLGRLVCHATST